MTDAVMRFQTAREPVAVYAHFSPCCRAGDGSNAFVLQRCREQPEKPHVPCGFQMAMSQSDLPHRLYVGELHFSALLLLSVHAELYTTVHVPACPHTQHTPCNRARPAVLATSVGSNGKPALKLASGYRFEVAHLMCQPLGMILLAKMHLSAIACGCCCDLRFVPI